MTDQTTTPGTTPDEERGETTTGDGARLAWRRAGTGPPLVLVHGITDDLASWDPLVGPLSRSHTVVRYDQRGHGASSRTPPYELERLAADLVELVTDLGLDRPVLVGHSLGGLVVTAAAAAVAATAVVNVDQPLALADMAALVGTLADDLRSPERFHPTLGAIFAGMMGEADAEVRSRVEGLVARADPEVVLGVWSPLFESTPEELDRRVDEILAGVTMPYVSVHGADPGGAYLSWLGDRVRDLRVEIRDGAGHFVHLVHPDDLVALVEAL